MLFERRRLMEEGEEYEEHILNFNGNIKQEAKKARCRLIQVFIPQEVVLNERNSSLLR
jgi:hypothetical protein